jgi:NADPH-dependent 2,4-dienoyl-CoA reductase/sulfur reductase-like enzyme
VEVRGVKVFVHEKLAPAARPDRHHGSDPKAMVIVGGGAAGFAAAQRLRDLGYDGALTLISADADAPYDRPNVSKDYLSGEAEAAWMPLKDDAFYRDNRIELRTATRVAGIDAAARRLTLEGGETLGFDRLLLATGAEPNRPPTPGFGRDNVHVLRSLADCEALIAAAGHAKTVAVVGASFIGLEAAAALRTRGLEVAVIAPDAAPLANRLGPQIGAFLKALHEGKGVRFHLGRTVASYDGAKATLDDGGIVEAALVVLGVGVKPRLALAEAAGLAIDNGVVVDADHRTSDPAIFAAGDIARYPDPAFGGPIRVEHWVVAERQGQRAAAAMLGLEPAPVEPPFFWTAHYGVRINYVGHAERWDRIETRGGVGDEDAEIRLIQGDRVMAVVTLGRDTASLQAAQMLGSTAARA